MPRIFAITTTHDSLKVQPDVAAKEVSFTITNNSDRPLKAHLKLKAQDDTEAHWLSITSDDTCELTAGGTEQATVEVKVPPGTQPGKYTFRIDAISVVNPDEDYTEGPTIKLDVQPSAAPKKSFPWWILAVLAVLLGVGGTLGWLLFRKVEVPNVVGEPIESAKVTVSDAKLTYLEIAETSTLPPGEVTEQEPDAGEKVKRNSEVTLTFAVAPEEVEVPNVKGLGLIEAMEILRDQGFSVEVTGSRNRLNENVVNTKPLAGEKAAIGSVVVIQMPGRPGGIIFPDLPLKYRDLFVEPEIRPGLRPELINP